MTNPPHPARQQAHLLRQAIARRRAELVTWLVRSEMDMPPEAVTVLPDWMAADHLHGEHLADRWFRFRAAVRLNGDALNGRVDLPNLYLDLTCPNVVSGLAAEAAIKALEAQVDQARMAVITGKRRAARSPSRTRSLTSSSRSTAI